MLKVLAFDPRVKVKVSRAPYLGRNRLLLALVMRAVERVHIARLDLALKVALQALLAKDVLALEKAHALEAFLVAEANFANKLAVVELERALVFVVILQDLARAGQFDGPFLVVVVVTGVNFRL